MAFSYSGDPSTSDKDAVRFEIQDTNSSAFLLLDAEVAWAILTETGVAAGTPATISGANLYGAAARCCEVIARGFLAVADTQVGQLKIGSKDRAKQYASMAQALRARAQGFYAPYSGGQSIGEKRGFESDVDAVLPAFTRRQWDQPWAAESVHLGSGQDLGPPVV